LAGNPKPHIFITASGLTKEQTMLETIHSLSMLTLVEIIGPILLLAALVYATWQWSRRRRSAGLERARDRATRRNYAAPGEAPSPGSLPGPVPAPPSSVRVTAGGWVAMTLLLMLLLSGLAWLASSPSAVVPETTGQGPAAAPPATNR
jgi:hypothetical protein